MVPSPASALVATVPAAAPYGSSPERQAVIWTGSGSVAWACCCVIRVTALNSPGACSARHPEAMKDDRVSFRDRKVLGITRPVGATSIW
jgi:hypothetical protein